MNGVGDDARARPAGTWPRRALVTLWLLAFVFAGGALAASWDTLMARLADQAPIVRFVNLVLFQAVQDRASDIHFEPFETEFKIRYRVDGALYEMSPPPKHLALPVVSRLKVMANLNISERRLPQDGRISYPMGNRTIDLRVSTLPTQFGESVVLRVLDRAAVNLEIESLGADGFGVAQFERRPVHVKGALPGEVVSARVVRRRRGRMPSNASRSRIGGVMMNSAPASTL